MNRKVFKILKNGALRCVMKEIGRSPYGVIQTVHLNGYLWLKAFVEQLKGGFRRVFIEYFDALCHQPPPLGIERARQICRRLESF